MQNISTKLFDALKLYSKQLFLSNFIPIESSIKFNDDFGNILNITLGIDVEIDDPNNPILEIIFRDPSIEDYNILFIMYIKFNLTFEKIIGFEINNNPTITQVKSSISVDKERAYKTIKLWFEKLTHQNIENLYKKIQLLNVEMV